MIYRLFSNEILRFEDIKGLLYKCMEDKQLCLAVQY